jgi:poly(3-hydroxybutyrate) depolymerase
MRQNDLKKVSRFTPSGEADVAALNCHARPRERDDSFTMKRHALDLAVLVLAAVMIVATVSSLHAEDAEQLPALGAELSATSVSGLSSGAYMAGQIEVAHSSQIVGAGLVAGGPFACAETEASKLVPFWPVAVAQNAQQALYKCMKTTLGVPDPKALAERAKVLADAGKVDPLSDLAKDNIYLFSGNEDQTVARAVVEAARDFFKDVGVPESNITLVENEGGHAFITEEGGAACGISAKPYVSDCDYDQAKAILAWIYGSLQDAASEPKGRFIVFDQQTFARPGDGFADEGVIYVPPACAAQQGCRVHIALHGCEQSREAVGDDFIKESGFARVADTNQLIILFPQTKTSAINPQGCWDWWGYTDLDYLGKDAPQITAIWSMVEQLAKTP